MRSLELISVEWLVTKIVVLASGSGSNAEAIIRFAQENKSFEVKAVISDRVGAGVLERAQTLGVKAETVAKLKIETKEAYEQRLVNEIKKYNPEWVVLAGFMKLLSPEFLKQFHDRKIQQNRIVNIHPSLLPLFPGKEAYEQSFAGHNGEYGCTIHFVDEGMDTGKIIWQERLKVEAGDTFISFKARGLASENKIYPLILEKLFKEYSA